MPALVIVSWLVPGLPLLLAGEFAPVPALLIAAPLATALVVNVLHRIPGSWPVELPGEVRDRGWGAWFGLTVTFVIAAGFGAWQLARNSPSVFAARTPGAYFQTGYWIAQHGSLPIPGSLRAFGGPQAGLHLASIGFFEQGHSVVPGVMAGLPMLLAGGFWTSGTGGGAAIGPILGGLAVLSFGGLVGRLAGCKWAPVGALALALTLPELYTSRDAFAEPAVQVLLFGGTSLVIDAITMGRRGSEATGATQAAAEATLAAVQETLAAVGAALSVTSASAAGKTGADAAAATASAQAGAAAQADSTATEQVIDGAQGGDTGSGTATGLDAGGDGDLDDATMPLGALNLASASATEGSGGRRGLSKVLRGIGAWSAGGARRLAGWPRRVSWRELPSRLAGGLTPEPMLAAMGGVALGLTSLLSLGSLVYLVPVVVVAAILAVARRGAGVAFCISVVIGCGYGFAAAYLLARPLADSQASLTKIIGEYAGGVVLLTLAALLLRTQPKWLRFIKAGLARRPLRWLPGLLAFLLVAALAGLAIRPYLQTVTGALGHGEPSYVATLQRIAGLKADPGRLYYEDTLWWVIWYAGIATVLLGAFAAGALLRRGLRALFTWQDGSGAALNWALPLAVIIGGSAVVLWDPATVPDQPWASRRLVPVVIPGLILLATWAAAWLARRARERGAGTGTVALVAAFCAGAMALPAVTTSFGLGLTHSGPGGGFRASAGGFAQHRVGVGEIDAVRGLCGQIGRSSSVLIVDQRLASVFAQVIRGTCGVPVAWTARGTPASRVDAVLGGILKAGRRPVVLGVRPSQVGGFGGRPTLVVNLATSQNAHVLTQPATAPWRARYVIWMAVANSPDLGV